jgi:hypothetical protein
MTTAIRLPTRSTLWLSSQYIARATPCTTGLTTDGAVSVAHRPEPAHNDCAFSYGRAPSTAETGCGIGVRLPARLFGRP